MTSEQNSASPSERIGPYVLTERLGQGGMAEVYAARLQRDEFVKLVAIKRMLPHPTEAALTDRFFHEARMVASLRHPNLAQAFDFGVHEGRPYLVMELVDGVDLYRALQVTRRTLPVAASVYIAAEVARGLAYVHAFEEDGHALRLVHRDVSPQNIIIGRHGDVKIVDFGIAKAFGETTGRVPHTEHDALLGKMRYMAPEQLERGALDGRTDLYALGVILHELLTGEKLIEAHSLVSMVSAIRQGEFSAPSERNPEVSPDLDAIVKKLLAVDPANRYADGLTVARALQAHLGRIAPGYSDLDLGALVNVLLPLAAARTAQEAFLAQERATRSLTREPVKVESSPGMTSAIRIEGQRTRDDETRLGYRRARGTYPVIRSTSRRRYAIAAVCGACLALLGGVAARRHGGDPPAIRAVQAGHSVSSWTAHPSMHQAR